MSLSAAEVLGQYLIQQGVFGDPQLSESACGGWPLYTSMIPDRSGVVDDSAAIIDTQGVKDARTMEDGKNWFHFGVQIIIRSQVRGDGFTQATTVAYFCEQVHGQTFVSDGATYTFWCLQQTAPILYLGLEEGTKRRALHTLNYLVTYTSVDEMEYTDAVVPMLRNRATLLSGVPYTLISTCLPVGQATGGKLQFVVVATDGSGDIQVVTGEVNWNAINKGGSISGLAQLTFQLEDDDISSSSIISVVPQVLTASGSMASLEVTVTSSLTSPTIVMKWLPMGGY